MYWSKYGLLGFFEMTPRIATSLFNVFSDVGPSDERAVIMTLITPVAQGSVSCTPVHGESTARTLHEVVVLRDLLCRAASLNFAKQSVDQRRGYVMNVGL